MAGLSERQRGVRLVYPKTSEGDEALFILCTDGGLEGPLWKDEDTAKYLLDYHNADCRLVNLIKQRGRWVWPVKPKSP
jgi:hypothetical protein